MTGTGGEVAQRLARSVAEEFDRRLLEEYVPRIRRCVELLSKDQLWEKPGPHGVE